MALAKKADKTYLDVENSLAGTIRVYHVPDAMLLSIGPDTPEPELPTVRMKTATGFQERQAKAGDKEYQQYQQDKQDYDNLTFQLRTAISMVNTLKDIDWTEIDLSKIPPVDGAKAMYDGNWPEHDLLRKKAWLDWTILFKRNDQSAIYEAISQMNGESEPTDDMIEEVKKSSESSSGQNQKN